MTNAVVLSAWFARLSAFRNEQGKARKTDDAAIAADIIAAGLEPKAVGEALAASGGKLSKLPEGAPAGAFILARFEDIRAFADQKELKNADRGRFMNPARQNLIAAIYRVSGVAKPSDKPKAEAVTTGGEAPATTASEPSEADTNESAATIKAKIEASFVALGLEVTARLLKALQAGKPFTAGDVRDLQALNDGFRKAA